MLSFNCRGLPKRHEDLLLKPHLNSLFNSSADFILLQETWYAKQELSYLNSLHPDFHGTGVASIDFSADLHHGHPPGGVAIFWRTELDSCISVLQFEYDWVTG